MDIDMILRGQAVEAHEDGRVREEDDVFNPYGSGPVPVREREPADDQ
jgi:hypothetical protein